MQYRIALNKKSYKRWACAPLFFLKEYRQSAKNFPKSKVENVIHVLKEYDLKSKGIDFNSTNTKEEELLKEMVWKILHA